MTIQLLPTLLAFVDPRSRQMAAADVPSPDSSAGRMNSSPREVNFSKYLRMQTRATRNAKFPDRNETWKNYFVLRNETNL